MLFLQAAELRRSDFIVVKHEVEVVGEGQVGAEQVCLCEEIVERETVVNNFLVSFHLIRIVAFNVRPVIDTFRKAFAVLVGQKRSGFRDEFRPIRSSHFSLRFIKDTATRVAALIQLDVSFVGF